ncbi:MAG TPA: hypothetical protein VGI63_04085, partial [Verrucomicrobiae bacterium]
WNSRFCFRLPVKACRPQPRSLRDRFIYGSRTVANHKQGREIFIQRTAPTADILIVPHGKILK